MKLGRYMMGQWPLPQPAAILTPESPSGFTDAGGGACSLWTDPTGPLDFAQGTGANRPAISTLGDLQALDFTAASPSYMDVTGVFMAGQSGEVWIVFRADAGSLAVNPWLLVRRDLVLAEWIGFLVNNNRMAINIRHNGTGDTWDVRGTTALSEGTTYVGRWVSTGSAFRFFLNGVEETLNVVDGPNNGEWFGDDTEAETWRLGMYSAAGNAWDGKIGFVAILEDGNLTDAGAAEFLRVLRGFQF